MIVANLVIAVLIGYVSSVDAKSIIASKDVSIGVDAPSSLLIPPQLYSPLSSQRGADHTRQDEETCEDIMTIEKCIKRKNNGNCDKPNVIKKCMKTCGLCEQEEDNDSDDNEGDNEDENQDDENGIDDGDDEEEDDENDEDDIPDGDNEEEEEEEEEEEVNGSGDDDDEEENENSGDNDGESDDWCNEEEYGTGHTMCIYEAEAQPSCGNVTVSGITDQAMKDTILNKHNELRALVANGEEERGVDGGQPKATNMRELVWCDKLAEVAQRWVNQCIAGHDKNRRTDDFENVGQNWAWAAVVGGNHDDSNAVASGMVQKWYDEVKDITLKAVGSFDLDKSVTGATGDIGHYTQVVWADTTDVGCGFMTSNVNERIESVLVCNYGPTGNWLEESIYEQGETGSNCPEGTEKAGSGLCVALDLD